MSLLAAEREASAELRKPSNLPLKKAVEYHYRSVRKRLKAAIRAKAQVADLTRN